MKLVIIINTYYYLFLHIWIPLQNLWQGLRYKAAIPLENQVVRIRCKPLNENIAFLFFSFSQQATISNRQRQVWWNCSRAETTGPIPITFHVPSDTARRRFSVFLVTIETAIFPSFIPSDSDRTSMFVTSETPHCFSISPSCADCVCILCYICQLASRDATTCFQLFGFILLESIFIC